MRCVSVLCALATFAFVSVQGQLPSAQPCIESACQLPDCRCSSTNVPGNLNPRDIPQFVLVTFDSAVSVSNIVDYRDLLYRRSNKDSCPVRATFFVSHEYTDYTFVNELYNRGFEIGLNSMTRHYSQQYWRDASEETLMREFGDQRNQLAHFANIPSSAIQGIRAPMLQLSGNATFQMMIQANFKYDMSWPTVTFKNPGLWPYTLHYKSIQDCFTPNCPSASLPGPWVVPMVTWSDLGGVSCSVIDSCYNTPANNDENGWFNFFVSNFERHYLGNRAPFNFHIGQALFSRNAAIFGAVVRFFDMLNNLHDAYMVSADEVVEWVKNPISLNEYSSRPCPSRSEAVCRAIPCNALQAPHKPELFYMQICNRCPRVYPWLNNPLGVLQN